MPSAHDAATIGFRIGQIDAMAAMLLGSGNLLPIEMREALALRWLSRSWHQYRKDRAIVLGTSLIGAECTAERNAFLALLEHALPENETPLHLGNQERPAHCYPADACRSG